MKVADNVKEGKETLKRELCYWYPTYKLCSWELPQGAISRESLTW